MPLILGLETSCDETAAAVVADGRQILSSVVASQIELHRRYGGVFPEIASRQHILDIVPVITEALAQAKADWTSLDALAVTTGPGLVGSLLVGVNVAKGIAWAKGLPLIGVNHLEAHLYANWLIAPRDARSGTPYTMPDSEHIPPPQFPLICLIVSGGHTDLVLMTGHGQYRVLGRTLDDAAGEAFDKVARLLGLGYPGGPAIEAAAQDGNPNRFDLPRAMLEDSYDFSFSGLKTAVLRIVQKYAGESKQPTKLRSKFVPSHAAPPLRRLPLADLAASFQAAVVDVLVKKVKRAAEEFQAKEVLLAGGVASNALLRQKMSAQVNAPVRYPPPILCTDNAAMVASAGYFKHMSGERATWDLDVRPGLVWK
ncbi:MAG: tRNA (adenosine(37)-N6)-threonylcarbamoyltransferase complex transferase subunit TsaD [Anaerolineae bacterium]